MKKLENKAIRKAIQNWADSLPDRKCSTKEVVKTVGYKYVTITDLCEPVTDEKYDIDWFYDEYIKGTIYEVA